MKFSPQSHGVSSGDL